MDKTNWLLLCICLAGIGYTAHLLADTLETQQETARAGYHQRLANL